MKTNLKSRQAGIAAFTLIELLAVIAIMGILAGIVLAVGAGASKKAKINRAKVQLQHIISAIDAYKLARGTYPPDNQNPGDIPPPANPLHCYEEMFRSAEA